MATDPDPTSDSGDQGEGMLTPLQEDIAALVAEGLANRDCGTALADAPSRV